MCREYSPPTHNQPPRGLNRTYRAPSQPKKHGPNRQCSSRVGEPGPLNTCQYGSKFLARSQLMSQRWETYGARGAILRRALSSDSVSCSSSPARVVTSLAGSALSDSQLKRMMSAGSGNELLVFLVAIMPDVRPTLSAAQRRPASSVSQRMRPHI